MLLNRVTFTGADDSVQPAQLATLSRNYPFVEWGILFSGKRQGGARFPSESWLDELSEVAMTELQSRHPMRLSAHLCGSWVRGFMSGDFNWLEEYDDLALFFQRVQINFHGEMNPAHVADLLTTIDHAPDHQFIFQIDGSNDLVIKALCQRMSDRCSPLFDESGGAGIQPDTWPSAWPFTYCGFAGGLGPGNVSEQLIRIAQAAKGDPFWIDMERHVRTRDDRVFDLGLVQAVLGQVQPMVEVMR